LKNKNVSLSLRILLFRVSPPTISSKRKKRATHQQKRDTRKRASVQLVSGLGSRKASFFLRIGVMGGANDNDDDDDNSADDAVTLEALVKVSKARFFLSLSNL